MSPWIEIAGVYALIALSLWRCTARWLLEDDPDQIKGWGELWLFVVAVSIGAVVWGVWAPLALVKKALHDDPRWAAAQLVGQSRAHRRKRMAERISELEKELEL